MVFFSSKNREKLEFLKEILVNEILFQIRVEFSKKKSSSVNFKEKIITFKLSSLLTNKQAREHFNSLLKRIILRIQNQKEESFLSIKEVLEKGQFNFVGELYKLEYTKNQGVKLKENIFYINFHTKEQLIEKHIINLLIEKYSIRIQAYVLQLNKSTYNFPIKNVELKYVKSKWGHCTHDNKLMFNLKLLNSSPQILDYVIYHEISHIKHKNHSQKFWNEVAIFCPNYKLLRKQLKDNPPTLFN